MKNGIKTLAMWLIIFIIFIVLVSSILDNSSNKLAYSELVASIDAGEVEEIVIDSSGTTAEVTMKNDRVPKEVNIPSMDNLMETVNESMKAGTIEVSERSESFFMVILSLP